MTVPISTSAPVPADDNRPTSVPAQRGKLGNRSQVDDRAVRPSDLLPYRRPSNSPAVELGKRAYDVMAYNNRQHHPVTLQGIATALQVDQAELLAGIAAFLTASTGVEFDQATAQAFEQAEETVWWNA